MPNPAPGYHEEVRRSTGHIMVTVRYSNQRGSKSRQILVRSNRPTASETYRRQDNVTINMSLVLILFITRVVSNVTVWCAASTSESELQSTRQERRLSIVLPTHRSHHQKRLKKIFWLSESYSKTSSYATLYKE